MSLERIIQSLSSSYWLDDQTTIRGYQGTYQLTKSDIKYVLQQVQHWLNQRKHGRATNWAALGLLLDAERFIDQVRKVGMLRPSKHSLDGGCIGRVVDALLHAIPDLPLHIDSYLRSVCVLCTIVSDIRDRRNRLLNCFRTDRERALKGMLANLDFMFLLLTTEGRDPEQKTFESSDSRFFDVEDYAEGFSYAFHLYHDHCGTPRFGPPLDPAEVTRGTYLSYLRDAAHIRAFLEIEVLVDCFDYSLTLDRNTRLAVLAPPAPHFERAIRMGYMSANAQAAARHGDEESLNVPSMRDLAKEMFDATKGAWMELRTRPFERYRFTFVAFPKLLAILQDKGHLFKEELNEIENASGDFLTSQEDLLAFEFAPNVRAWDLLIVQRLFNFIRLYASHSLLPLATHRQDLVLQSLVPVFTDAELKELLSFVVTPEKTAAVIQFLSWNSASEALFDVQYQPIIQTKHERLVPTNILGCANSFRNSFQLCRKRLYPDGVQDPLSAALLDTFKGHTWHARAGMKYRWKAESGELDVVALFEGRLFVLECKNSLLPTGAHELRTSYDYIRTAAEQLGRFERAYSDQHYRELLAKKLGWPIDASTRLVACIVMSNRMFSGYRARGFAVRSAGEVSGFMTHGLVRLGSESRSFWKGDRLTGEDLQDFIEKDITYKPRWESLEEYGLRYRFGAYTIERVGYRMSMLLLAKSLGLARTATEIARLERGEDGAEDPVRI